MRKIAITHLIKRFLCSSNVVISNEMKYLNVAEKHDAAKTIAGFLSRGASRRREGFSVYNKIFDFEANVRGQNAKMVMTSVSGHLLNYEFLISFKNWQNCDPQQLFDAPIRKSCTEDSEKIKRTLEREVKSCQGLIIWTDCDREGENIGYEIIQVCQAVKPNLVIYRAKFSEITAAAIRRALANLTQPDKRQSDAVDVRQELDLRTGAAFTRFQTIRLQKIFPAHIADKLISYGSCQIPTLGFVARRYKEVEEFVSEPFWFIRVLHTIDDLTVQFSWDRNRLFNKEACEDYLMLCLAEPQATVISVTTKPKNKWRPCPMDTVELEKLGSRKLKLSAKEVMTIAEKLYTQGIISYPRTETTMFSPDINLRSLVEQHTSHPVWGEFASRVMEWGPNPRKGNKSDQAHPPIHPIKFTTSLSGNEQRVYELIVRHFLACVSKDATGSETIVNITIAGEKFHANGLCIYERNYLDVYIYEKWNAKQIHRYENGQTFDPTEISMQEGCTTAPPLLTEADLIALMEKHGIGTDATHAEHIHKIKERGYIGEAERGLLVPGTIGMGLYEGYDAMELSLAYPMLRAEFETDLKKICTGEKNPKDVLREQIVKYKEAYKTFTEKIRALDAQVAKRLNETIQESNETTMAQDSTTAMITSNRIEELFKCPKCKKASMALRRKKDNNGYYLGCLNFPECRNSVWFTDELTEINLTDNHCNRCGPGYRMMKIKFKQSSYLRLLNETSNVYKTCIGCDTKFREIFNINVDSIKNVGGIVNNQSSTANSNLNGATIRQNSINNANNSNSSNNSNNRSEVPISRSFSTASVPSSNNGNSRNNNWSNQRRSENREDRRSNTSNYRGWFQNNENTTENLDDVNSEFFNDNDDFENFIINPDFEDFDNNTNSSNLRNSNNTRNNNMNFERPLNNQQNSNYDSFSIWNTTSTATTASVGNSWPSNNSSSWTSNNSSDIPWGRKARAELDLRNENAVKCSGCHQPAKELVVRKDGPNQGRTFYKCPKQTAPCTFFVWADEANQQNQSETGGNFNSHSSINDDNLNSTNTSAVLCNVCQGPTKYLVVKKEGPNKGRNFYVCSINNNSCEFFKWADENENPNNGQISSWGTGNNASTSRDTNSNWGTRSNTAGTSRADRTSSSSSSSSSNPKKRKCGLCRQEGHTKLKCPRKDEFSDMF